MITLTQADLNDEQRARVDALQAAHELLRFRNESGVTLADLHALADYILTGSTPPAPVAIGSDPFDAGPQHAVDPF